MPEIQTQPIPRGFQKIRDEAKRLQAEIAVREERLEVLREAAREALLPDTYGEDPEHGQVIVSEPARQFDLDVALTMIPANRFPWKQVPDKDAIKEMDPSGRLYDDCLMPPKKGKKRVTFV